MLILVTARDQTHIREIASAASDVYRRQTVIGLLRQRTGSVQLQDRELSAMAPHQRARGGIGYVPQGREIIPQLTVRENSKLRMEALPGGLARLRYTDLVVFDLFTTLEQFPNRRGGYPHVGRPQPL